MQALARDGLGKGIMYGLAFSVPVWFAGGWLAGFIVGLVMGVIRGN